MNSILSYMQSCKLCPRKCGVNRAAGQSGYCRVSSDLFVARASLHMWEEPCLSGKEGSGTVFFSGCSLGCCYCQNRAISRSGAGKNVAIEELADIFIKLQKKNANNINLVTAGHYVPQVAQALRLAKRRGLHIPIVYNSSGYEYEGTLKILDGLVDIYLPDFKYMDPELGATYSKAKNYPEIAKGAIREMVRQARDPVFDERGIMQRGVIVRHLLLPGHVKDSKKVVEYLYSSYGNRIYISLMNQYTPMPDVAEDPLLSRKVTRREFSRLVEYALGLGLENGFVQEGETAKESFIPAFDGEGVNGEQSET